MLKNYFKIAFRNLLIYKGFAFINILGLTLGMACCFLILLFVRHELSYDTFQEKYDRIYRVTYNPTFAGLTTPLAVIPPPPALLFKDNFPEMEDVARMYRRDASIEITKGSEKQAYEEERFFFADPAILKVFTFQFLEGNPQTALNDNFNVIITEEYARKYFGQESALGKTLIFSGQFPMKVSGVVKAFPDNSHIKFNFIANYETMFATENAVAKQNLTHNWVISHSYTYVLLKPGQNPATVNARFPEFLLKNAPKEFAKDIIYELQPMKDFHLRSNLAGEPEPPGSMTFVYVFIGIAFITLLIACINFINLSTARSLKRAKEVGMRKVLGAEKKQLISQFLGESFMMSSISFVLSIGLMALFLPAMNELTGKNLSIGYLFNDPVLMAGITGIFILTALLAGSYPSFFVSGFLPVETLKGNFTSSKAKGGFIRQALVVVQFAASIALVTGALIAFRQLQFMQNKPLGFEKDYIVTIPLYSQNLNNIFVAPDSNLYERLHTFENILKQNTDIQAVTLSNQSLGNGSIRRGVIPEGFTKEDNKFISCIAADFNFLQTYKLKLLAGRDFSEAFETDKKEAFIINETGAKSFGWQKPAEAIGKMINREGKKGKIIGVVSDFHSESLQVPLDGVLIDIQISQLNIFSVKINAGNIPQTLDFMKKQWNAFFPGKSFQYTFLDENIAQLYENEIRLSKIISYFAGFAILISCLGLYGLISLVIQQKTKEIGVRKVLGASVSQIVTLLSKDFLKLVLISFIIATPLAWYTMNQWLKDFAYRIDISWWIFALAGGLALLIALLTISFQAIKAALANPVKSLRTE